MKERTKFVLEWERRWDEAEGGAVNMAELCRMFGISRQTGYVWVQRYRDGNRELDAIAERSRRPKTSPTAVAPEVEEMIVEVRKRYPRWGPRKLRARLVQLNPGVHIPSASVMSKIFARRGLSTPRRRRRRVSARGVAAPFSGCDAPNAVWCIDFKGWFLTADGRKCYPLTIIDAYSRYLIRCEGLTIPDGKRVKSILDLAFQEYGLPAAIRSDGGPPFASTGPARLTDVSVWLLRLGIRVEIIAPGKPQQNGRLERLHRTLKAETTMPPAENYTRQQRVFDLWRREYNQERPHEALQLQTPASVYAPSRRSYPRPLVESDYSPAGAHVRVDKHGFIHWRRRKVFITHALRHEVVVLLMNLEVDGRTDVSWGQIPLGYVDEHDLTRGLIVPRRRRGQREVSGMSFV